MWGSMKEVWNCVWGECGGCVKVGESVVGCGEMCGKVRGEPTHSSTSLPSPSTLTRHLFPHPHTHLTLLPTFTWRVYPHFPTFTSHISPHPSYFSSHPPQSPHLSPSLTSPNTCSHSLPMLPHNPHASSNTSPYFTIYPTPKFLFSHLLPN